MSLYRAARAADPTYFTAQHEYVHLMVDRFRGPELRREFADADSSSPLMACLMAAAAMAPDDERPVKRLLALESRFGATPCTDAFLVPKPGGYSTARAARALRDNPHLPEVLGGAVGQLYSTGQWQAADAIVRSALRNADNPLTVVALEVGRAWWYVERGDSAGALEIWNGLTRRVSSDGRPGVLAVYHAARCNGNVPRATRRSRDDDCARFFTLVRKRHALFVEWVVARRMARRLLESGELAAAAPVLTRCVQLADRLGVAGMQLDAYTQRGRYFVKSGQLSAAVQDLRRAIAHGAGAELPYYLAEAYHNLAHAHEGSGRFGEAAAAADTFAGIAATLPPSSLRWSSRHDAGVIRWSAGWHAAAARDFDAMVRIVDELGNDGHAFAGEYFERTGNLARALHYYRVGAQLPNPDVRNLAALARVYEAIGFPDSAELVARRHDAESARWPITGQPLLPDLLERRGRARDALAIARTWARRQLDAGNVEGAAIAHVRLAELLLRTDDAYAARIAAERADSLVSMLRLTPHAAGVRTVLGRALLAEGRRDSGLAVLRDAVLKAQNRPAAAAILAANVALGSALEALSRGQEALTAYDRAASAVEGTTARLNEDAHRAGYKSSHMAPFDGGVRILLAGGGAGAAAALEWSARRKAAALLLSGQPRGPPAGRFDAALRSQLQPDEAFIDYTVLDSSVAAIVVRQHGSTRIRLRTAPAQLAAWIEALRRPLVAAPGGSVDLAHARFDVTAAESLYAALIRPLQSALGGARRLALSPDDVLWYVPFAALVASRATAPDTRPTYLIEQYELRLVPSARFLSVQREDRLARDYRVGAFAYQVPGDSAEMAALRSALGPARLTVHAGSTATERNALNTSADVLHMAVHGVVDDRDPLSSHLVLAPEGVDDGLLHLSEVAYRRDVPRLVVLTACEAASGRLYAGEGLVGIARAFLLGGTRHVIGSQWPVGESAADLTSELYRALEREGTASALRSAQLALMSRQRTAHPLHWAGFAVFEAGGSRAIQRPP